jgi:hypothetical protein
LGNDGRSSFWIVLVLHISYPFVIRSDLLITSRVMHLCTQRSPTSSWVPAGLWNVKRWCGTIERL